MKKTIILSFLLIFGFWSMANLALAQEATSTSQEIQAIVAADEVTTKDLGVEEPGILPSSPFYFLKNWGRGVQRIFTFNPINRAALELQIVNQQAAEIKKMEEAAPVSNRLDAISQAIGNYQSNVDRLKNRLEDIEETSKNPKVNDLLEKLIDRSIKHQELFDNLMGKFEASGELKDSFKKTKEKLNDVFADIPDKFENSEMFRQGLERAFENRPERTFKELRAIEILDQLDGRFSEEVKDEIQDIKDNLTGKFEERMAKFGEVERAKILSSDTLKRLSGDHLRRIEILEEIGGQLKDSRVKLNIKDLKDKMFEGEIRGEKIGADEIDNMILRAEELIADAEEKISNMSDVILGQKAEKLLSIAKDHLSEAEKALEEEKFGEAFGHSTVAIVHAKNVLRQLRLDIDKDNKEVDEEEISDINDNEEDEKIDEEDNDKNEVESESNFIDERRPVCTQEWRPVCGKDGKTYPNACTAKSVNKEIAHLGVCQTPQNLLEKLYQPFR